jgi:hypothetical protein
VVSDKDSKFIYDLEEHKSLTERSEQKALRLRFRVAAVTSQKDRFSESAASLWESVGTAIVLQIIQMGHKHGIVFRRSQNCEKRLLASSCPSVHRSARNKSSPSGRIFMKFDMSIFRKPTEEIQVSLKSDVSDGYLT